MKDLPFDNIVLKKFREKDEYFNPKKYLGGAGRGGRDEEILQRWKIDHKKKYLEQFPHLSRPPIRYKKVLSKSSRPCLR